MGRREKNYYGVLTPAKRGLLERQQKRTHRLCEGSVSGMLGFRGGMQAGLGPALRIPPQPNLQTTEIYIAINLLIDTVPLTILIVTVCTPRFAAYRQFAVDVV